MRFLYLALSFISFFAQAQGLPQKPSINRDLLQPFGDRGTPEFFFPNGSQGTSLQDFNFDQNTGKGKPVPYFRQSFDGRLLYSSEKNWATFSSVSGKNSVPNANVILPMLLYVDPENYDIGSRSRNSNPVSTALPLHPIIYYGFHPGLTNLDTNSYTGNRTPYSFHLEICNDTGDTNQPTKACRAYTNKSKTSIIEGDCYNVTLLNFHNTDGANTRYEMRSSKVTVFVSQAKLNGREERIHVYPREDITQILPPLTLVDDLYSLGSPGDQSTSNLKKLTNECGLDDKGKAPDDIHNYPYYCRFIYNQKISPSFSVEGVNYQLPTARAMFEPSATGDGRLLFLNVMGSVWDPIAHDGTYYAYSSTPCDVSQWTDFRKLSHFPYDSRVKSYPLSAKPFRDGVGRIIPEGESIPGAYVWVDRMGRNLFYSLINLDDTNKGKGHGIVVMGSWTGGKMITVEGNLNLTDFGHASGTDWVKEVNLYQDGPTPLRPTSVTQIGSPENMLNNYNAFAPTVPFDVVWRVSGNNQKNSDVIFDDYMSPNLWAGTHMMPALTSKKINSNDRVYSYAANILQNIAEGPKTNAGSEIAKSITFNASRIEPVAQGGVHGRGLFLHGNGSTLNVEIPAVVKDNNLVFNIWVDPRNLDTSPKTLMTFPSSSFINLTKDAIWAVLPDGKYQKLEIPLLANGKYFHFSLKVEKGKSDLGDNYEDRLLTFYINGTKIAGKIKTNIPNVSTNKFVDKMTFNYQKQQAQLASAFTLGKGGGVFKIGGNTGIKGWIDELRIYEFRETNSKGSYQKVPTYFEEIICNQALGSLIIAKQSDANNPNAIIRKAFNLATKNGLIALEKQEQQLSHLKCEENSKEINDNKKINPMGPKSKTQNGDSGKIELYFSNQTEISYEKKQTTISDDCQNEKGTEISRKTGDREDELSSSKKPRPLVSLVCEQMELSGNSINDFADTSDSLCATTTHRPKNGIAQERCYRNIILDLADKPLQAGKPRPDFSNVSFCINCHQGGAPGLGSSALLPFKNVNRERDTRRQPLDPPRVLGGCAPNISPYSFPSQGRCQRDGFLQDYIFDFYHKM